MMVADMAQQLLWQSSDAVTLFAALDDNGDGALSCEEILRHYNGAAAMVAPAVVLGSACFPLSSWSSLLLVAVSSWFP